MFYGRGAGGEPTASAVLGDLIDAAVNRQRGHHASHRRPVAAPFPSRSTSSVSVYYVSIQVADRPGVLAAVAGVFGEHRRVHPLDGAGGPVGRPDGPRPR